MGRGPGKNNMSEEQLKANKRERDLKSWHNNKHKQQKKRAELLLNAKIITCGCGKQYKDIIQNKNSHERTQRHSLWDEEETHKVRELICRKVNNINTLEEAQTKLDEVYLNAERYNFAQKEGYIPTLLRRLNKIEDKPIDPLKPKPKIKRLVIKKKLNIINE